jgi:hypothetical protein
MPHYVSDSVYIIPFFREILLQPYKAKVKFNNLYVPNFDSSSKLCRMLESKLPTPDTCDQKKPPIINLHCTNFS